MPRRKPWRNARALATRRSRAGKIVDTILRHYDVRELAHAGRFYITLRLRYGFSGATKKTNDAVPAS
jgi:hypothetical protein